MRAAARPAVARLINAYDDEIALVDEVGYVGAFSFKYSARPGTPAAELSEQVPEPVKSERLARLQQALERHQRDFNAGCIRRRVAVLFEKRARFFDTCGFEVIEFDHFANPTSTKSPPLLRGRQRGGCAFRSMRKVFYAPTFFLSAPSKPSPA